MASDPWAAFNPQGAPAISRGTGGIETLPTKPSIPSGYEADPTKPGAIRPMSGGPADDTPKIIVSDLSGDAYLKTLDEPTAAMVKALSDGRKAFPTGAGLRAPYWQTMLQHLSNYDPGFDEANYTGRVGTRKDFTSGKAANNIRALNTAIGHLGHLNEQVGATASHGGFPFATTVNAVENTVRRSMGDAGPTNFDTTVSALAGELTAVYRGAGGAEADIQRYISQLSPNASKEQKEGAIRNIVGLLKSRLDALNDQYRQGMGTTAQQLQLLDPQAQLVVQHLGGFDAAGAPDGTGPADPGAPPPLDVNPIVNGGGGDQGPTLGPSGGDTRSVVDPKKQALGQKIVGLVSKGADRNTVMGFAVGADPTLRSDPEFRAWVDEAIKFRQQHPKAQFGIDPDFYTTKVPLSGQEKIGNDVAQSGAGAAIMNAGDAVTAGNMGKITGDEEGVNRALAVAAAQHPNASLVGTIGGGATAAAGLEGLLGLGGMAPGVLRATVADTGYGATAGATNSDDPATGAVKGGLAALLGSFAGNRLARGTGAVAKGVTNPTVGYVAKDVPLTIGQAVSQSGAAGRIVKGVEDRLSGIPVIGDAIKARRLEGMQKMNAKAFDRALEPIGAKADGRIGEEAVAHSQDQVSAAFSKALAGKSAGLDHGFIVDATKAKMGIEKLPDRVRGEVDDSINEVINNYFDDGGQVSGENMQAMLRELGAIKRGYQGDPLGHRIGRVVDSFTESVENLFRRQAPDVMPQYDAAKRAFRRVSTLEDAVLRANKTGGVFTPAQIGMADRANTVKFGGKHAAAAGKSPFHEFQRNMQEVLPSKVPDSGTAGRLVLPLAAVGLGSGAGYMEGDTGKGLTLGALLALAYSRGGQRVLTGAALKRGNAARAAGRAVQKAAPLIGHGVGAATALGTVRD